jgi:hypothetical protein
MLTRLLQMNGRTIQPEELSVLQSILDDLCLAKGIEHDSVAAIDTASFLISAYQSGVTNEQRLRRVVGL